MAKVKVEDNFIWIILAAIRIYSTNFLKFCRYMLFPVLGQIIGLLLIFCLVFLYAAYLPDLADKYEFFRDYTTVLLLAFLITIPGLLIFLKAFWDFLVAYGALNSITEGFLSTGKIYDYEAHNATVTTRSMSFIGLWFLYSLFLLVAINPFFWVIGGIFFIYFILLFQVFSFEPEESPTGCMRRSLELVSGNWFRTVLIMIVIGFFTHFLFVEGFSVIFDFTQLTKILGNLFESTIITSIPIDDINEAILMINPSFNLITSSKVAEFFVYLIVSFIVVGFTLPLRSITWTLWYKALREKADFKAAKKSKNQKGA